MIYKKSSHCNFLRAFLILKKFPNCQCRWGARDKFIIWEYDYTSSITLKKYRFCLNYEAYYPPKIWIVDPDFTQIPSSELKHIYSDESNRLCLYHSRDFQWSMRHDIIQTIVTWAFLWVEFYEIWKETGNWYAEEAEHTSKPQGMTDSEISRQDFKKKSHKPTYLKNQPVRF